MEEAREADVPVCRMEEAVRDFSNRQSEIIELVGRYFLTYSEVADRLHLSTRTVEDYASQIRDASGLKMRPRDALIRIALRTETSPTLP